MIIVKDIDTLRAKIKAVKQVGGKVGLVPTMGYFHDGHLSLMRGAKQENDYVVVSVFVNPIQFGQGEDFEDYPRDPERDCQMAEDEGVDLIFHPTLKDVYPDGFSTYTEVENLTEGLCGNSRPGHFRGVTTIVAKLFNMVQPDKAYFGQKDAQQALVIKRMVRDLNFPLEVVIMPIARELDGLAMSSRNIYLKNKEREAAIVLNRSLQMAAETIRRGEKDPQIIVIKIRELIQKEPLIIVDYVEIVDTERIKPVSVLSGEVLIALAVRIGKTRLIDNIILEVLV